MDLMSLMPSREEAAVERAVHRAVSQIGNALKDYGLYIACDPDGNFCIQRLPADFHAKYERASERLRRMVIERIQQDEVPPGELRISDEAAKTLSEDLADLQLNPSATPAEIYQGMLTGKSRFMDIPITVIF